MLQEWSGGGMLFGKMWEDPLAERALIPRGRGPTSVFCVASAGDTAFALAADPRLNVEACDVNPAQVHLCQLKLALLRVNRLRDALQSDARLIYDQIAPGLPNDSRDYWDGHRDSLRRGIHRVGRVDRSMAALAYLFSHVWARRGSVERLLECDDRARQAELVRQEWRGARWTWAFRLALHPLVLRLIYGAKLSRDLPSNFPSLMQARMEAFLSGFPARENPYLWQTLAGHHGPTGGAPYLRQWGEVSFHHGDVADHLRGRSRQTFDFLALSNILEVASPRDVEVIGQAALHAARPGGLLCLRFIVPRPPVFPRLELLETESLRCSEIDRAFFCNHFQVYRL